MRLSSFVLKRMFTKGDPSLPHAMTSVPGSSMLFRLKRDWGLMRDSTEESSRQTFPDILQRALLTSSLQWLPFNDWAQCGYSSEDTQGEIPLTDNFSSGSPHQPGQNLLRTVLCLRIFLPSLLPSLSPYICARLTLWCDGTSYLLLLFPTLSFTGISPLNLLHI